MSVRQGPWTGADVPGQSGRIAVVTGANSGIGFEAAAVLARRGAHTVLACRDAGKAEDAVARLSAAVPEASVSVVPLDLASLESVRAAADQILAAHDRIDLLINNAGLMWPPYGKTTDGFELQFGTNHLGHFALTGLVLEAMLPVPGSRVVTVSSNGHRAGRINFADLQSERRYGRMTAYAQSKLANLMFTYELQRRMHAAGAPTAALAAHPGVAFTELTRSLPTVIQSANHAIGGLFTQSAAMGALPTLRAATDPAAAGGEYYGPGGLGQVKGYPVRVSSNAKSRDQAAQQRLWAESQRLTGVTYPV
ncbi:MAG TPA: SDR family NAD(P)-dependent oxidoreductase [Streptosporangiaceae bacterium]|jgi:NAD(P)-dependent dehydrogenase (short-subunit alcohol dehydrogenase family)|nr:SDR family NAD(P)-dependent oxidoreductase [Streptosporangiaceae bacterium]